MYCMDERCKRCIWMGHFPIQCYLQVPTGREAAGVSVEMLTISMDGCEAPANEMVGQGNKQCSGQLKKGPDKRKILGSI